MQVTSPVRLSIDKFTATSESHTGVELQIRMLRLDFSHTG